MKRIRFAPLISAVLCLAVLLGGSLFAFPAATVDAAIQPVNPNTNQAATNILNYLRELTYSEKTLFGAFDWVGHNNSKVREHSKLIKEMFGVTPGMIGLHYSIGNYTKGSTNPDLKWSIEETNKAVIEQWKNGNIVMLHNQNEWANVLMNKYSNEDRIGFLKHFDATEPTRNMEIYNYYLKYREIWADGIEELAKAGVTVLYRPFVEMNNPGFPGMYAPTDEGKEHFKRIWQQMYDYLFNERKLNNVLLCFSPLTGEQFSREDYAYYPGDEYVDIISPTIYSHGYNGLEEHLKTWNYDGYIASGKPFGFSEFGVSFDSPTNAQGDWGRALESMKQSLPLTSFAIVWCQQTSVTNPDSLNAEKFVHDPRMVYSDDIPDLYTGTYTAVGELMTYSSADYKGASQTLGEGSYSAAQLKKLGFDISKIASLKVLRGYEVAFYTEDNCKGTALKFISYAKNVARYGFNAPEIRSIKITKNAAGLVSQNKPATASDAAEDAHLANDGKLTHWETDNGVDSWLAINLQGVYAINRWKVEHAENLGEYSNLNTSNFKLQYSMDGTNWYDADVVIGNQKSSTSQYIAQVHAQFVRLYITRPNSSLLSFDQTRACIVDWGVYGVKMSNGINANWKGTAQDPDPETPVPLPDDITDDPNTDWNGGDSSGETSDEPEKTRPGETTDTSDIEKEDGPDDTVPSNTTKSPQTTNSPKDKDTLADNGALVWGIVGIAGAAVLAAGVIILLLVRKRKKVQ